MSSGSIWHSRKILFCDELKFLSCESSVFTEIVYMELKRKGLVSKKGNCQCCSLSALCSAHPCLYRRLLKYTSDGKLVRRMLWPWEDHWQYQAEAHPCVNCWDEPLFRKNCSCPCAPFLTCLTFPVLILKILTKLNILVNFDVWMSIHKCYWLNTPLSFSIFFSLNKIYSVHACYVKIALPQFLYLFLQIICLWLAKHARVLYVY